MDDDLEFNEDGSVKGTNNDARLAMYNKMADQVDALRAEGQEFLDVVDIDKGVTAPFKVQKADGTQEPLENEDVEAATIEAEEAAATGQAPELPYLTVNGKKVSITPELIAKAQKIEAADQYLQQAVTLRSQAQQAAEKPAPTNATTEQAEDLVALTRAIQMGTEEEAAEAIGKLRGPKGLSKDDVLTLVQEQMAFQTAATVYNSDFKDIVSDPLLNSLAIRKDEELRQAGDRRPYLERWASIGKELRKWKTGSEELTNVGDAQSQAQPRQVASQSTKQARKAAATGVPSTANAVTQSLTTEDREPTVSETIAAMAQSRGGNQAMFSAPKI